MATIFQEIRNLEGKQNTDYGQEGIIRLSKGQGVATGQDSCEKEVD